MGRDTLSVRVRARVELGDGFYQEGTFSALTVRLLTRNGRDWKAWNEYAARLGIGSQRDPDATDSLREPQVTVLAVWGEHSQLVRLAGEWLVGLAPRQVLLCEELHKAPHHPIAHAGPEVRPVKASKPSPPLAADQPYRHFLQEGPETVEEYRVRMGFIHK